jgi:hypothetical protein
MKIKNLKYSLLVFLLPFVFYACRQAKYVPDGEYLYKVKTKSLPWNHHKKTIHFITNVSDSTLTYSGSDDLVYVGDLYSIVKPQPNRGVRLAVYNSIDSAKMNRQIERKKLKTTRINAKKTAKENSINKKRNEEAKSKGKDYFFQKKIKRKKEKTGWRFWVVNKMGEKPILSDSSKVVKTNEQINIYLKKKGFYNSYVKDTIIYNEKKKKAYPRYSVYTGVPYKIGEIKFDSLKENSGFAYQYSRMNRKKGEILRTGDLFDSDKLDIERERFSKFCRDEAYFGFNKNYIAFLIDTNFNNHTANVYIKIKPKLIESPSNPDEFVKIRHSTFMVSSVVYNIHNKDSLSFKDFTAYKKRLNTLGLDFSRGNYPLLDTLHYIDTIYFKDLEFNNRVIFGSNNRNDTVVINKGTFIYNEELAVNPMLLDNQNFLEINMPDYGVGRDKGQNGWYKEYYIERSYRRMLGLDVFSTITPTVIVDQDYPLTMTKVTYDLTPSKKHLFSIQPRGTNSNGFLGVSAAINYTNKNLFGGAEKLKVSFTGGLESQPIIFETNSGTTGGSDRLLNTFEISPKISLEFPKLVPLPMSIQKTLSKRMYPSTIFDLSYNYQQRTDFDRSISEFAYSWKYNEGKSQVFQIKWQSFNYVKINKTAFFEQALDQLNDPFLTNSYSDHFSNKFQLIFTFNNQRIQNETVNKKGGSKKGYIFNVATYTQSGLIEDKNGVGANNLSADNLKQIFNVPFTQFFAFNNELRGYYKLTRTKSLAARFISAIGYAYGNSPSLPYEESFYAGGSNDVRAWEARTMSPGGYKAWKDTSSSNTQIGDVKLELNLEYRFQFSDVLKAAWFIDAGNIWKLQDDPTTPDDDLSVFSFSTFQKQLAIGGGFGLRIDFDFFLIRLDLAIPLYNPHMFEGEKWIWESRELYDAEVLTLPEWYSTDLNGPFAPRLNIGIGYPF